MFHGALNSAENHEFFSKFLVFLVDPGQKVDPNWSPLKMTTQNGRPKNKDEQNGRTLISHGT